MTEPIECHSLDPSSLNMLCRVVDDVWSRVEPTFTHLPLPIVEMSRDRLARVVFTYALLGLRDPLVLRALAHGAMKPSVKA